MSGVEGLQQVESFAATDFANNDSVWPVTKSSLQKITDRNCWYAGLFTPRFKSNQIALADVQFSRVFDEENSFLIWNEIGKDIEQRGLACAGSTTDEDILAIAHSFAEKLSGLGAQCTVFDQIGDGEVLRIEFPDCERNAINTARRKDRCHSAPIR